MKKLCLLLILLKSSLAFSQQNFSVQNAYLGLTNIVNQFVPHPTNTAYYTLTSTNTWYVSGTMIITAHIGDVIKLSWNSVSNQEYIIQYSTNGITWKDIQVKIYGSGGVNVWYDTETNRTYRLTPMVLPPTNLRVL